MPTLTNTELAHLLTPYLPSPPDALLDKLSAYLDLLLKWNARTNLTAIRTAEQIVTRHFGESLFAARHLGTPKTLLDFGSGAGFPGIPLALLCPEVHITLAESQNKKSAFLREVIRTLGLPTEVWPRRTEDLPPGARFDCVTLRAVDSMLQALATATGLADRSVVLLTTREAWHSLSAQAASAAATIVPIPGSAARVVASMVFHVEHAVD